MPLAPILRRFPLVRAMRTRMLDMNSEAKPRPPMDPVLRRQLLDEFDARDRAAGQADRPRPVVVAGARRRRGGSTTAGSRARGGAKAGMTAGGARLVPNRPNTTVNLSNLPCLVSGGRIRSGWYETDKRSGMVVVLRPFDTSQ